MQSGPQLIGFSKEYLCLCTDAILEYESICEPRFPVITGYICITFPSCSSAAWGVPGRHSSALQLELRLPMVTALCSPPVPHCCDLGASFELFC